MFAVLLLSAGALPQSTLTASATKLPQSTIGCRNCSCPCVTTGNCTCPTKQCDCIDCPDLRQWKPGTDGSGDYGYWQGATFKGRWFAATSTYRPWDGTNYGEASYLAAVRLPAATFPTGVVVAPQPAAAFQTMSFGGGCSGGRCR